MKIFNKFAFGLILMFMGVSTAFAQSKTFTVLPGTDLSPVDCKVLLNQFIVNPKIPSATEVNKNSTAKDEALQKATDEFNAAVDASKLKDSQAGEAAKAEAEKKYQQALADSNAATDVSSNATNVADSSSKMRDNLLGCAIKTGRISLAMVPYFITYISNFILGLVGLVAVFFIVLGGYFYVFGGLTDDKDKGKNTIKNALMGLGLSLLAWTIVSVIMQAVTG